VKLVVFCVHKTQLGRIAMRQEEDVSQPKGCEVSPNPSSYGKAAMTLAAASLTSVAALPQAIELHPYGATVVVGLVLYAGHVFIRWARLKYTRS
jgi:hypothetical protein